MSVPFRMNSSLTSKLDFFLLFIAHVVLYYVCFDMHISCIYIPTKRAVQSIVGLGFSVCRVFRRSF